MSSCLRPWLSTNTKVLSFISTHRRPLLLGMPAAQSGQSDKDQQAIMSQYPPPVGYNNWQKAVEESKNTVRSTQVNTSQSAALLAKKQSKAMSMATSPFQQMAMNAFMLWFSGSQLNMFSINTVSSAIMTPLGALLGVDRFFGVLGKDVDTKMAKVLYIVLNLAWLGVGLYKMSSMRLLPTTSADWTSKLEWKTFMETTSRPPMNVNPF
jgi:ER membrane protein complex subunit 4